MKRAVTLIRAETVAEVSRALGVPLVPGASRRNVTVSGLDLDALAKGTRLSIGDVVLEVTGPCDPCPRMEQAFGPGALAIMEGRGGVCARILRGGVVRPGDAISAGEERIDPERVQRLQSKLLGWYRASNRDLPWRRTRDPYAIWLSEVMLQQTQVATVIPYWEKFLAAFPSPAALAAAPQADVLALWSGLGYYARARNLHRAAQAIVERHDGLLPPNLQSLRDLPGFGPYTAGAVASIAFGLDAPLVDGNVARVLCRIEGWAAGADEARTRAWTAATELLPSGRAGDWNQALMELGATVCSPASPSCDRCPVRSECRAAASGEPARFPLPKARPEKKVMRLVALCARRDGAVQLVRRAEEGLFGGLWELPSEPLDAGSDAGVVAQEMASRLQRQARVSPCGAVSHVLTHRRLEVEVFSVEGRGEAALVEGGAWVRFEELPRHGLSTLAVKVLAVAGVVVPGGHGRRRAVPRGQGELFRDGR